MVNLVKDIVARQEHVELTKSAERFTLDGLLPLGVPEDIRHMIVAQFDRLPRDTQRTLEAACIAGVEFSVAAIVSERGREMLEVESQCEDLVRGDQFLRNEGVREWADGVVATQYRFVHGLYQEVLYDRIPAARHQDLHRRVGERLVTLCGPQARDAAAEITGHFERSREYDRAVP